MIGAPYADDQYLQNKIFVRSVVCLGYLSMILRVPQYDISDNQLLTKRVFVVDKFKQMNCLK